VEFINNITSDGGKKCDGIDGKVVALMVKKPDGTYSLVPLPACNDGDDDDRPRMMWISVDSYITRSDDYWSAMTQNVARAVKKFNLKVSLMGASMNSEFGASSREDIPDSDEQFVNTVDIYTSLALDGTSIAAVNIAAETINTMLRQL
jgi:hypothetical protein